MASLEGDISNLPSLPKDRCVTCQIQREGLDRCQKCRTAPYCSRECQVADWKNHKKVCMLYVARNVGASTSTTVGEKGPSRKKNPMARTRGEIIRDLSALANEHNGYFALDLLASLDRAKTHFLAVTLKRNFAAKGPRDTYTLIDAKALPFEVLDKKFGNARAMGDESVRMDPREMVRMDLEGRMRDPEAGSYGILGNVLVVSVELNESEESRSVQEAVEKTSAPTFQPLGLFKAHQKSAEKQVYLASGFWKECLKNALKGGIFHLEYIPYKG